MKSLHKVIAAALFIGASGMVVPALAAPADKPAATDTKTDAKPDAKNASAADKSGKAVKKADAAKADKDAKDAKAADADKDHDKGKAKKIVAKRKAKPADEHAAVDKEPKKDNKAGGESEVQRTADLNRQSLDNAVHPASAPGR